MLTIPWTDRYYLNFQDVRSAAAGNHKQKQGFYQREASRCPCGSCSQRSTCQIECQQFVLYVKTVV